MIDEDEVYGLHCEIGRLEQENARLKELIYDRAHDYAIQHMTEDELRITAANAMDDNRKLRELMSVMAYCIQGWRECDGCRVNGGSGIITGRAGCDVLLDRLRELGVEVDE